MATRNIVPRADSEGGIGTSSKKWANGYFDAITTDTIALLGGQIAFPAVQAASAGVNTLDDYEEGTFTPAMGCSTSGTITLATAEGVYCKIGGIVTLNMYCHVGSVSSPVGMVTITALPFTAGATGIASAVLGHGFAATADKSIVGFVIGGTTTMYCYWFSGGNLQVTLANYVQAETDLYLSVSYRTA